MSDTPKLTDAVEGDSCPPTCSTFAEHREQTAKDCEQIAEMITKLAADVREGNLKAFEAFWWEGGTEEGDAKICALREMLLLRYAFREESIESNR
jgi:methionine salvage enolase-phosphatase E1